MSRGRMRRFKMMRPVKRRHGSFRKTIPRQFLYVNHVLFKNSKSSVPKFKYVQVVG